MKPQYRGTLYYCFLAAFFFVVLTSLSYAQTTGTLRGQVTDPTGAVIPDAVVSARSASGQAAQTKTDGQGYYQITGLASGIYNVGVTARGFTPVAKSDISVAAGQVKQLNVPMEIQVENQQVTVEDQGTNVDVSSSNNASALILKGKDLDALSDDPDELQSELQALAGPSAGPNGGEIYIDGFTGGQIPPKSAIREIRVNQNPFSAQYDKLGYGRIEILTKPGTDSYHGQFFFSGNTSSFNSKNPFAVSEPGYDTEFYNANLGGPLLSKKASFYFNAERRNINDVSVVNTQVLDSNFAPVAYSATLANPRTRTNISPRVDFQITPNNTLTARYQLTRDDIDNQGVGGYSNQVPLPSQAYNLRSTEHTIQISDTQLLSTKTVNETRFEYERDSESEIAQNFQPTIIVLGAFTGGGNNLGQYIDTENHYEVQNYTSTSRGNHLIRLGGRLRVTREGNFSNHNFNGTFTFPSLSAYQITEQGLALGWTAAQIRSAGGGASQFSLITGQPSLSVNYVDVEPYVEDDWRVRPNMTLSYGLRYETQNAINDHNDFAPRLGFAWGLSRNKNTPKTVLRAGFGVFYDRFQETYILEAARLNGLNQQQLVAALPDFYPNVPAATALSTSQALPTIYQIDPNIRSPYTMQSAIGLERQVSRIATVSATYVNSRGVHQFLTRNINAPLPGTYNPAVPNSGVRPFGDIGNIYQYQSEGIYKQNQLITNFNLRASTKLSLFGFYTLSYANSDTSGISSFPVDQYNLSANYGRAQFDIRHRLFVGGTVALPYSFRLSPFVMAMSGSPFDLTLGQDLNGDSIFNDRPTFAMPGDTNVKQTPWGTFNLSPIAGERIVPVNYATAPGLFTFNLRVSKTFGFGPQLERSASTGGYGGGGGGGHGPGGHGGGLGARGLSAGGGFGGFDRGTVNRRYSLTFSVAARNLFNNVNVAAPIGVLNSPLFGQSTALAGGPFSSSSANRRIDLQGMFSF